jgi:hypothetical protein
MLAHKVINGTSNHDGARFSVRAATSAATHQTSIGSTRICGRANRCGMTNIAASTVAISACTGAKLPNSARNNIANAPATLAAVAITSPAQPK